MLTMTMKILFAMSIGCFFAVLWVMLAIVRRLRSRRTVEVPAVSRTSLQEFFEAGEYRTPRSLRLVQNTPRLPLAEITFDQGIAAPAAASARPLPLSATVSLFGVKMEAPPPALHLSSISEQSLASSPAARPRLASIHSFPKLDASRSQPAASPGLRKSPQPDRAAALRRLDLSRYGEQTGDLTDPYTRNLNAFVRGKWSRGI